jgi:proline dehydrogenase
MKWFNRLVVGVMPVFPKSFIWIFSRRYIAGKTLSSAVAKTQDLNEIGCRVTIDLLGEDITSLEEANIARMQCLEVLDAIQKNNLEATLSLKLTQLGLRFDMNRCYEHVKEIVQRAEAVKNFVRIDMEDSTCTDDTLSIYRKLRKDYKNVGTVIQAYMKRSQGDVEQLIKDGIANIRVCKGIYDESPKIAFKDREKIRDNFMALVKMLFESKSYAGIATHDRVLVNRSLKMLNEYRVPKFQYEFQMLLGVTENMRNELVADGHGLRIYVPYGEQWYGYCMRRMKENPQVAGHVIKNVFIRG